MTRRLLPLVVWPLWLVCCARDAPAPGGAVLRDSAGVRIVENHAMRWSSGAGWRLGDRPLLQIGVADGAESEELAEVQGVVRLRDGDLVVADGASRELRFFADDGMFLERTGGRGRGPGEFVTVGDMWRWLGDSVAVWDPNLARLSIFDRAGQLARSTSLERGGSVAPGTAGAPRFTPRPLGTFRDGTLAAFFPPVRRLPMGQQPGTTYRDSFDYVRYAPDGMVANDIARLPGDEWFFFEWRGSVTNTQLVFGKVAVAVASKEEFYYSSGAAFEVLVYSPEGSLIQILRVAKPPRQVTAEITDAYKASAMETAPPGEEGRWQRWLDEQIPFPETLPSYSRFIVDAEDHLWAEEYTLPSDSVVQWSVFDPDGELLGQVRFPDRFRVSEIGSDYVLGVWRDSFDVEHVQLYDLIKPEH